MNIYSIPFSPTGHSALYSRTLCEKLSPEYSEINLTHPGERHTTHVFSSDDIVCIGAPVYGGRLPAPWDGLLDSLQGNGARAVCLVTYGNRDYDDALLELCDLSREKGFHPVAAGAFLAQHTYSEKIASHRPDARDWEQFGQFIQSVRDKLRKGDTTHFMVKGNHPYKQWTPLPLFPQPGEECIRCGECADACPVQAIDRDDPALVNKERCLACYACVAACPLQARTITAQPFWDKIAIMEEKLSSLRREPEWFL